jgi:hypothetical protein
MALHEVGHGDGQLTEVQGTCAFLGDAAHHRCQLGVLEHMPHGPGLAIGIEKIDTGHRVVEQAGGLRGLLCEQGVQALADGKTLLCQVNRGLKELGPREAAMLFVRGFQHAHRAGHAHRAPAHHGFFEGQGLAVVHEEVFIRTRRRCFAPIPGVDLAAIEVHEKGPAADAAGLRLHQREHHLHSNRGIDRAATSLENVVPRPCGQQVGSGH